MSVWAAVVVGVAGAALVIATVTSAVQTVVVPRGTPVIITRWVFVAVGTAFQLVARRSGESRRDRLLAALSPVALLTLVGAWLVLLLAGFTAVQWSLGAHPVRQAFTVSGSSLFTLGFDVPHSLPSVVAAFAEAALGLGVVALLISYLPAIYSTYSRRESAVTALETFAGSPPSAVTLLVRVGQIKGVDELDELFERWRVWFGELEETHSSNPSLVFFRSPQPTRSWVSAAGTVLDTAAFVASTVDGPPVPEADLVIRAGYLALRRIADYFAMPYDPDPAPGDPIAVTRAEYDQACAAIEAAGVPLRHDRDAAWASFSGWRVNYDVVLRSFASLISAPKAPWSSDRPEPFRRAPLRRKNARARL